MGITSRLEQNLSTWTAAPSMSPLQRIRVFWKIDTNAMSARHWEEVSGLPYSEEVRCYLAAQMELELAMESLLSQLEEAGKQRACSYRRTVNSSTPRTWESGRWW